MSRAVLLVPCLPEREALSRWRKFAKLVPDHLFSDRDGNVVLAIVHEKFEPARAMCTSATACLAPLFHFISEGSTSRSLLFPSIPLTLIHS